MAELKIGEYVLKETLGSGTFGKVKIGESERTGHRVAVKIMSRERIKSMDVVQKIRKEISLQKDFRHPHIVRLYQTISTPTDIFMIMEYISGGELFGLIQKKTKLGEPEARKYYQQLMSGLDYCHRHHVVHRDIKPENILLDSHNNVKLTDFGLSTLMSDGGFLDTSCGSPNYASPEILSGQLYAGPEVDIWSSGIILYAMCAGTLPFNDDHVPTLFKKIRSGLFYMPKWFSAPLQLLLHKLLQVDPQKRATIKDIREDKWFQIELPRYLFLADHADASKLDYECIYTVAKEFGVTEREVADAIEEGNPEENMLIAYYLLVDNKQYAGSASTKAFSSSATGISVNRERTHSHSQRSPGAKIGVGSPEREDEQRKRVGSPFRRRTESMSNNKTVSEMHKAFTEGPLSTLSATFGDRRGHHKCFTPGQKWCKADCELCPTWGISKCIFSTIVPDLAHCDTYQPAGDVENLDNFLSGAPPSSSKHVKRHPEHIAVAIDPAANLDIRDKPSHPRVSPNRAALKKFKRTKWHLGIRSNSPPVDIMLEIYKVMTQVGLEWIRLKPFSCIVRRKEDGDRGVRPVRLDFSRIRVFGSIQERKLDNFWEMTADLNLYMLDSRGGYILDFKSNPSDHNYEEEDDDGGHSVNLEDLASMAQMNLKGGAATAKNKTRGQEGTSVDADMDEAVGGEGRGQEMNENAEDDVDDDEESMDTTSSSFDRPRSDVMQFFTISGKIIEALAKG